jgi:hypothetical protein
MKKGVHLSLQIALVFFLIASGFALALTLFAPSSPQFLVNLIYFIIFLNLHRKKAWAFYPGIAVLSISIVWVFLLSVQSVIIKFVVAGVYMLIVWLLLSSREKFRN